MNDCIALCHFCEAHGPAVVLQTSRGGAGGEECVRADACFACRGPPCSYSSGGYASTADAGEARVRGACLRSLSCETCQPVAWWGGGGGGRALAHAFRLRDARARGLKRRFSLVALSDDAAYLAAVAQPLANHFMELARELRTLAQKVYDDEQAVRSQRALRLTNDKACTEAPRSLAHLTGNERIFEYLHTKFVGILLASTKIYSESVCNSLSGVQRWADFNNPQDISSLYQIRDILERNNFIRALFCALVGIQIIVRGDTNVCSDIVKVLQQFCPKMSDCIEYTEYVPPKEARIFHCRPEVAIPKVCSAIFRIDVVDTKPIVHWSGESPAKWPSVMANVMKAIDAELDVNVLKHHIVAIKEEWNNNITALKYMMDATNNAESIIDFKKITGLKTEDECMIQYWIENR